MKKSLLYILVFLLIFCSVNLNANNISVSNVSLEGQVVADHYCLVDFDLSWDNSWRTTSIPQNWDAAWVFVKFRVAGGEWQHATLNATGTIAPTGSSIDIPADNNGAFIYRDSDGNGTFSLTDVQLRWDYGEDGMADDASLEVKVFAIEIVYIPQSDYYLGDGAASKRFFKWFNDADPYLVSDAAITIGTATGNLNGGNVGTGIYGPIDASYPTGYKAFYCMKYEISQEQYVDFLNTLTRDQQNTRTETDVSGDAVTNVYVMSGNATVQFRNGVKCDASGQGTTDPIVFYCDLNDNSTGNETDDGQNLPCNYINWMDFAAYADWAGLRPMTEGEFEKQCRGLNAPVANEYPWGNTSLYNSTYTFTNVGAANEGISDLGENIGNMMWQATAGTMYGPIRCGIFAASSTNHTRVETGATYYGIMGVGSNLLEFVVYMLSQAGLSYTGLHGDGVLLNSGDADTDYWPGINNNSSNDSPNGTYSTDGVTNVSGAALRGAYFGEVTANVKYAEISNRDQYINTDLYDRRFKNGGRLIRSAP